SPDAAVVRSGTSDKAPLIGRIVPSWKDGKLSLRIEPAGGAAVQTTVFERASGGGALDRGAATRGALEGSYRATLHPPGDKERGRRAGAVSPEGGARVPADPPA